MKTKTILILVLTSLTLCSFSQAFQISFTAQAIDFFGGSHGAIEFGDFDGDGDLDLLLMGEENSNNIGVVYINTGTSFHKDSLITLPLAARIVDAKWGDYDNDGDLDIFMAGKSIVRKSRIFKNDGGSFTEIDDGFEAMEDCAVDWGDYDNDGDLDIAYTGRNSAIDRPVKIYNNSGIGFVDSGIELDGSESGDLEWVDFDNDGDLDLFVTGLSDNGRASVLYKQDQNLFSDTGFSFPGYLNSSSDWGDFDQDGDLDLLISGNLPGSETKIFRNDLSAFTEFSGILEPMEKSDVKWADFNNDGALDIIIAGSASAGYVTKIYVNNGTGFDDSGFEGPNLANCALAVGDYDNDGDLDFAIAGWESDGTRRTFLYSSNTSISNGRPFAPTFVDHTLNGNEVTLFWNRGRDTKTDSMGLTYNLRIGTAAGLGDIKSSHTIPITKKYKLSKSGNVGQNLAWATVLGPGTYFWEVQAVDNSFSSSVGGSELSFVIEGSPFIEVTQPNGGEEWNAAGSFNIRWNDNIAENVKIDLFKGAAFDSEIVGSTESDGEFQWSIPGAIAAGADYKVKITSVNDGGLTDVSNNFFTINGVPSITVSHPNGGESLTVGVEYNVDWTSTHESDFRVEYSTNNGSSWSFISDVDATSGNSSTPWTIPNVPSNQCLVRVTDKNDGAITDVSNSVFSIVAAGSATITLSVPNGGEQWEAGRVKRINWSSTDVANIKIEFSFNNGNGFNVVEASVPATPAFYEWTLPALVSNQCLIRLSAVANADINDVSTSTFAIIDTTAPAFTNFDYSEDEQKGSESPVTIEVIDNTGVDYVSLFYKQGGETNFTEVDMSLFSGNVYQGAVPSFAVSERGVEMYVESGDNHDNYRISETVGITVALPQGLENPVTPPAGSDVFDYRLFSIPLDLDDKSPTKFITNNPDLGSYDTERFRWFGYDRTSQEIREYPDVGNITPDQGYFIIMADDYAVNSGTGSTIDASEDYEISVPKGWSLIGNPFNFRVPFDSLYTWPQVDYKLWTFTGDWELNESGLEPWRGYALWVADGTNFYIAPGADKLGKPATVYSTKNNSDDNWLIRIKATNGKSSSAFNFAGQLKNASDELDSFDLSAPPRLQKQVYISFKNEREEHKVTDIREINQEGHTWQFTCYTNPAEEVLTLEFSGLTNLADKDIFLFDHKTALSFNLKNQNDIKFAAKGSQKREFTLAVGTESYINSLNLESQLYPTAFALKPVFPNPFNPVTQLNYSIMDEGHVTLDVYNVLGQHIAKLVDAELAAGSYNAVWQAQNVSSGIYIFKLSTGNKTAIQRGLLIK
ncbi:MAG: T9SS C-terminal target domain-containing protein [Calditrichaeota bacterium]|nr:MAG: T9SS C-terminal target domain-containing protein [Calditrichota bacterium]MBL1204943.1 T9SS C-terminal target domain-containing protein [Calditrichota bacterium]NOG44772.1 T9SS type A sorting domain-containing protein [Calditrichota bacterium]